MRAMVLTEIQKPLELKQIAKPIPNDDQILIKVSTCAVCRTDLHIIEGDLKNPKLPLVLGHQIVGRVEEIGKNVKGFKIGDRVGVPWLQGACGKCAYCVEGKENLCDFAVYTGYTVDGGYAEYTVANAKFTFPIPPIFSDIQAAPLLCAGLIGFRSLRLTEGAKKIGFFGFGSSAHILAQIVTYQGGEVYAFTRKGDLEGQEFAKKMGAVWASDTTDRPPVPLDAVIVFAPVGELMVSALKVIKKGGIVVSAGIHMSDIPSFPYRVLWEERMMRSVSNLTRRDGQEFLEIAPQIPVKTSVTTYPLEKLNVAIDDFSHGRLSGTAVIVINSEDK